MFSKKSIVVIIGVLILNASSCVQTTNSTQPQHSASSTPNENEQHNHDALPLPKRLAFMTGHVEAGLALYRAGEPKMAAKHLQHPVSETHASERVGLDALGFDANLFIAVSEALDAGVPAAEIEPQLRAAQQNLAAVSARAGGDTRDVIRFLLDTVVEEYAIGVQNGAVTDPGEYQDAFGFTIVAMDRARSLDESAQETVQTRLGELLDAWPQAPIPPTNPTSVAAVTALVNAVRNAL